MLKTEKNIIVVNNFDIIRLFAATQVAICHSIEIMSPYWIDSPIIVFLRLFPGVPIFFFTSGFLISRSYERNNKLQEYGSNRSLRIFPALHVCVLFNIIIVALTGYFSIKNAGFFDVLVLYLAKTTFFQFYNPEFMRGFGDGVLNGSLWTVCVELQFYICIPIFYKYFMKDKKLRDNLIILGFMILSLVFNRFLYALQPDYGNMNLWKIARVSFLPWFYMFLFGVLIQKNFDYFKRILFQSAFPIFFGGYIVYSMFMYRIGLPMGNDMGPLLYFPLVMITFYASYTKPHLGEATLRKNDISYGIYIYHMPIVNLMLYMNFSGKIIFPLIAVIITFILAIISWFIIERPALRRKYNPLKPM